MLRTSVPRYFAYLFVIYRVAGEIIRLVTSVCVRVCLTICLWALSCLNRLTLVFFGVRVDLDLGYPGIVGQDSRSKVKVKQCVFVYALPFEPVVWSGAGRLGLGLPMVIAR